MSLQPSGVDDFYRFFRVSGMGHCSGGPGAWDIGQQYVNRPVGVSSPQNNVLEAIIAWVEEGQAPEYLEGLKWVNDIPSAGVSLRRRHCRYPRRNVYSGDGNGNEEDGWQCVL